MTLEISVKKGLAKVLVYARANTSLPPGTQWVPSPPAWGRRGEKFFHLREVGGFAANLTQIYLFPALGGGVRGRGDLSLRNMS